MPMSSGQSILKGAEGLMDDIFDQMMLSSSTWVDGVPNIAVDSLGALQGFSKMGSTMTSAMHMLEDMENQEALSDRGFEEVRYPKPSNLRAAASWQEPFVGSVGQFPSNLDPSEEVGPYSPDGEGMHNDLHLGKRTRGDENAMKANAVDAPTQTNNAAGTAVTDGNARPRVRARRGQATDPHSIAERNRRERIAERMKALQELVPDSNKTDKASMLDEIINYVKFLQMQVKCLSMCRLGGSGAASPLLADLPAAAAAEGAAKLTAANLAQVNGAVCALQDGLTSAERQVARLMDEDMSTAMKYLQSKGLCLMPISLATAISSTTGNSIRQPEMAAAVAATPKDSQVMSGGEKQASSEQQGM